MKEKTTFTQWQKDELCYLVGNWYIKWKDNFINSDTKCHYLEQACYDLKVTFLLERDRLKLTDEQISWTDRAITSWHLLVKDNIIICYETKQHKLGSKKESLKIFICNDFDAINSLKDNYNGYYI